MGRIDATLNCICWDAIHLNIVDNHVCLRPHPVWREGVRCTQCRRESPSY